MSTNPATSPSFDEPPMSLLTPNGVLESCNPSYLQMSGIPEASLVGSAHEQINHPHMPRLVVEDMWRALRAGAPWTRPIKGRRRDGERNGVSFT